MMVMTSYTLHCGLLRWAKPVDRQNSDKMFKPDVNVDRKLSLANNTCSGLH